MVAITDFEIAVPQPQKRILNTRQPSSALASTPCTSWTALLRLTSVSTAACQLPTAGSTPMSTLVSGVVLPHGRCLSCSNIQDFVRRQGSLTGSHSMDAHARPTEILRPLQLGALHSSLGPTSSQGRAWLPVWLSPETSEGALHACNDGVWERSTPRKTSISRIAHLHLWSRPGPGRLVQ